MRRLAVTDLAEAGSDGRAPVWLDLDLAGGVSGEVLARAQHSVRERNGIVVGLAHEPVLPTAQPLLEALTFTLAPSGPGLSWIHPPNGIARGVAEVEATLARAPLAATVLDQILHRAADTSVEGGLLTESLAYSTLQAGPEVAAWLAGRPAGRPIAEDRGERILVSRDGAVLHVTLNRPHRHNAFDRATRDALLAALEVAALDPSIAVVALGGTGTSFCSGGDLDEFGTFGDPASAHLVRMEASAGLAVHRLRQRVRPLLHGACIGAGIEIPAFAEVVTARHDAWFQLPELGFGLVPGAGGTVSIRRRIGPWRTAWMAMSRTRVPVDTALAWGLVDACG